MVIAPSQVEAFASPGRSYLDVFHASPAERVAIIKEGVSARWAEDVLHHLDLQALAGEILKLSPSTLRQKARTDASLPLAVGERAVGLASLIGQVQAMAEESGSAEGFDAARGLGDWLRSPLPAFGGLCPIAYLDTLEGRAMVSTVIEQSQSGTYA